uniref:Uncharacterized protein n=1 Tax=Cannabis sativa TaxID=3483 RepID=A0A803Q140_CANSA
MFGGKDMSIKLLMGRLQKEATQSEVEDAKKEVEDKSVKLGEVNKQLLAANKRVEELQQKIKDMSSTVQLEANIEALTKDLITLKDEREGLWTLLANLTKEKQDLEESLNYEKAKREENPNANFDYLNENKGAYLSFCEAQKAMEESEAANPEAPTSQSTDPSATEDKVDSYKEPRTLAM